MNQPAPTFRSFDAMGTRFECVLGAALCGPSVCAAIAEGIESLVMDEHRRLSVFDPNSVVSRLNRDAGRRPVDVDADLLELLARCTRYSAETGGAFDITAGALMESFGFRGADRRARGPTGAELIELRAGTVRFTEPGVRIDLGGIAKGYALDLAVDELIEQGVTSAMLHGGTSSVAAVGHAPDGSPWRVRLMSDDPASPTVELTDRCLACSAPSGRTVAGHGHIMDTRTGRPAAGVDAACVIGPSAEVCEAWSTALIVDPALSRAIPPGYESHTLREGVWHTQESPTVRTIRHETPIYA